MQEAEYELENVCDDIRDILEICSNALKAECVVPPSSKQPWDDIFLHTENNILHEVCQLTSDIVERAVLQQLSSHPTLRIVPHLSTTSYTDTLERYILKHTPSTECPICLEPIQQLHIQECLHPLCKPCAEQLLLRNEQLKCPLCRYTAPTI